MNQDISTTTTTTTTSNFIIGYFSKKIPFFTYIINENISHAGAEIGVGARPKFTLTITHKLQHTNPTHQKVSRIAQSLQEWMGLELWPLTAAEGR